MGNRFSRDKNEDDDKYLYHRYLENGKGELINARGLRLLTPGLSIWQVYPATPVYDDDCANSWMRPEMLRYGTFRGLTQVNPSSLARDGYYYRGNRRAIVCFCCGSQWPNHRHGCRRTLLNIPFNYGVGQRAEAPPTLQTTDSANQADIPLNASRRARTEDDHNVHQGQGRLGGEEGIAGSPARAPWIEGYRGPYPGLVSMAVIPVEPMSIIQNTARQTASASETSMTQPARLDQPVHPTAANQVRIPYVSLICAQAGS
ncbi:hypothetical protein BaRGS_00028002 [Batillaria attramentaria]|uniref:Uncharacterized protein n=1 Tax=Batillaria attramentaria TaxID=370345 RepID=A0ABD0K066_9CAEN